MLSAKLILTTLDPGVVTLAIAPIMYDSNSSSVGLKFSKYSLHASYAANVFSTLGSEKEENTKSLLLLIDKLQP